MLISAMSMRSNSVIQIDDARQLQAGDILPADHAGATVFRGSDVMGLAKSLKCSTPKYHHPACRICTMDNTSSPRAFPGSLNLGCGKDFRDECLNIDCDTNIFADATLDVGARRIGENGLWIETRRFGRIHLTPGCLQHIVAHNVLQQVRDLPAVFDVCLRLLGEEGTMEILVPYDLSYSAWSDPKNVRAFSEASFAHYMEPLPRDKEGFFILNMNYVPSQLGLELAEAGRASDEVCRQPRAIDALSVTLQKTGAVRYGRLTQSSISMPSASGRPLHAFPDGWEGHKDRHCIWLVSPEGYIHNQAFVEAAFSLHCAFEELGGSAPLVKNMTEWKGRIPIVYGGNLLPAEAVNVLPKGSIIINLEQASAESTWFAGHYPQIMKAFPVLDYSERNRKRLIDSGIIHAEILKIGYSMRLTRIPQSPTKDIDVLFYGSLNESRSHILNELKARDLNVVHLFGVYGEERDRAIARAKIVLNMHLYRSAIFEIIRVSYLLANGVCVLTEGDIDDPDIQPYIGGIALANYDGLIDRCMELINDEQERQNIAARGFRIMSSRSQSDFLLETINHSNKTFRSIENTEGVNGLTSREWR